MESAAMAPPRGRGPLLVGPREIYGREYQAAPHEALERKLLIATHELYEHNRKFFSSLAPPPLQEHEQETKEPMNVEEYDTSLDEEEEYISEEEEKDDEYYDDGDAIYDDDTSLDKEEQDDASSEDEEEIISEENEEQDVIFNWVHVNIDENQDRISGWTSVSRALDLKIENQLDENTPSWMRLSLLCPNLDRID